MILELYIFISILYMQERKLKVQFFIISFQLCYSNIAYIQDDDREV